jgi:hypothetical protein
MIGFIDAGQSFPPNRRRDLDVLDKLPKSVSFSVGARHNDRRTASAETLPAIPML